MMGYAVWYISVIIPTDMDTWQQYFPSRKDTDGMLLVQFCKNRLWIQALEQKASEYESPFIHPIS